MKSISLFAPLLAAALVSAHGYVSLVTIDSKRYVGDVPNGAKNPSIVRQINDVSPVKGANNPNVNCGSGAQLATLSANANPGSVVTFSWNGGDGSNVCTLFSHHRTHLTHYHSGLITPARC
jgi:hypothetical protein